MVPDHIADVDPVEFEDARQLTFIALFADYVTREEKISVVFNRATWLDKVNQRIVEFVVR